MSKEHILMLVTIENMYEWIIIQLQFSQYSRKQPIKFESTAPDNPNANNDGKLTKSL